MHDAVRDCCEPGRPLQQPHRTQWSLPTAGKRLQKPSSWLAFGEYPHDIVPGILKD